MSVSLHYNKKCGQLKFTRRNHPCPILSTLLKINVTEKGCPLTLHLSDSI